VAEDPNSPSSSGARRLRGDLGVPLRDLPAVECALEARPPCVFWARSVCVLRPAGRLRISSTEPTLDEQFKFIFNDS